ncbi:MAG: DUF3604 domain-containing protein [Halioglobus sp.]
MTASVTAVQESQFEPCRSINPMKQPFFGDLHVHTRYSLDASTQGTRTTPAQAYRFAQGEAIGIQPWTASGEPLRSLQLRRPLDFAMVSDHAELIGEVNICSSPELEGYGSWQCGMYRKWPRAAYYLFNFTATIRKKHLGFCGPDGDDCRASTLGPWVEMQQAAAQYNDSSSDCSFTTFVGYEWTGMQGLSGGNLHRNVVFRNAQVPELPASFIDAPSAKRLWGKLDEHCGGAGQGCDALVIPHNSNLSAGYMFNTLRDDGDAISPEYAATRARYEPLVEIMQHKGASECYFQQGVTEDELCAFEQIPIDNIAGRNNPPKPDTGFVRKALNDGMLLERTLDVNPFKFGLIASSDTHLGTPGAVEEDRFLGHGGAGTPAGKTIPPGLPDKLEYNPGGLAVLWAEQNKREPLFDAMRRKEAYATSGPRIISRFFAAWDYDEELCLSPDRLQQAYASGVPMGGTLPRSGEVGAPKFLAAASQDAGVIGRPGMPLQRIQVIKSWIDEDGARQEQVTDVAGDSDSDAAVDLATCATSGSGFANLCAVWTDPDFDPSQAAYYYSRVVENPSCRWSQRMCVAAAVDCSKPATIGRGLEGCCDQDHRPVVQERAWSSPIWYTPDE